MTWRRLRSIPGAFVVLAAGAALLPFSTGEVAAQGWIEPRPGVLPAQFGIEKLRTSVHVRVTGRVATVEVEEWFRNNGGGLGEGDYVYPLPGEAVFSGYSLFQGDQELRGEMMDAARAREIYESIVRAKKDPALIELVGKGMLRARVFPIEAGQTRRIRLRYTQVLDRAGDALQFRYLAGARHSGMRPDVILRPMPEPGRPLPDRGRPLPRQVEPLADAQIATSRESAPLTFTMTIDSAATYRDPFSPTHRLDVERSRGSITVRPRAELTGDFTVFLPFARSVVGLTHAAHRPAGEDGYFMLTLSPGDVAESRVPRDVTAVVDVSGSMSGEKMDQARRALQQLVGTLGANDRVRLIAFSSGVRQWRTGWTQATRAELTDARRWIEELRAEGGTNISGALEEAFRLETPATRLPVVVFMTDGVPTNGITEPERIVALAESSRGRARVFAFGVGYDVNTYLLDRLSEAARGTTQYVRPGEDVEEALATLAVKIRHPVLTDLALERGTARIAEVYPRDLPDLFSGEELVIFGRYQGSGTSALGVTGRRGTSAERYTTQVRFPAQAEGNEYITQLWASRKLGDLDRRIRAARADGAGERQVEALIEELRQTAMRYGLLSQYTAYLVQEPGIVALDGRGAGGMLSFRAAAAPPPRAEVGQMAVQQSEQSRRAREAASVADVAVAQALTVDAMNKSSDTRVVAGRTFALRDGVWEDTRATDGRRVVAIEPYSSAYFALARALPELTMVVRELSPVAVTGERVSIRVAAGGVGTLSDADVRRIVAEFRAR